MTRVWLAGSRSFGAAVFKELSAIEDIEVVAVTAPSENKDKLGQVAADAGIPVWRRVHSDDVRATETDLIVSAQNYAFIRDSARTSAPYGAIGYHPSLLPRHRGRSSVEWTIAMRDPIAGGSVYQMDSGYDTGPIILQDWCHVIPGWTASDLWREALFSMGVKLLGYVLRGGWYDQNISPFKEQDERVATTEPAWEEASAA